MRTRGIKGLRKGKWDIPAQPHLCRPVDRDFRRVRNRAEEKYEYLSSGAYRSVYEYNSRWVLKLPNDECGERDNIVEALLYAHDSTHRAQCQLVNFRGVWALKMEKLILPAWHHGITYPAWVKQVTYDGYQVGFRQTDRILVAYDYALPAVCNPRARRTFKWLIDHYGDS
jgi:hypothetical protein